MRNSACEVCEASTRAGLSSFRCANNLKTPVCMASYCISSSQVLYVNINVTSNYSCATFPSNM